VSDPARVGRAGIVALADFAARQSAHTDETLREISTPDS